MARFIRNKSDLLNHMAQLGIDPNVQDILEQLLEDSLPQEKKFKTPKRRVLCRVKFDGGSSLIVYRDGHCRWSDNHVTDTFQWKLGHSDLGPMFIYKDQNGGDSWHTDWASDEEHEIKIAETIAKALADLEVEKMLTSKG